MRSPRAALHHFAAHIANAVAFCAFVVELCENVEQKVCVADNGDDDGKFVVGSCELEGARIELDQFAKRTLSVSTITLGIDYLALVERNVPEMHVGFEHKQTRHL